METGARQTTIDFIVGDCGEQMPRLATGSVDAVVTSPPYNRGIAYRSYHDRLTRADYLTWSDRWIREIERVLSPQGSFFLNLGATSLDPLLVYEVLFVATRAGFHLQNTFHWIKAISLEMEGGAVLSRGHFRPVRSRHHVNDCHEYVFHLSKTGKVPIDRRAVGVPYADKSNIARWAHAEGRDRRCRGNTWFLPYPTIRSRAKERPHPASFPVELAERCLRLHGRVERVLDPFCGIGAAAVAAVRAGAGQFVGIEIDPAYVEEAWSRVRRECSAKKAHLELACGEENSIFADPTVSYARVAQR